MCNFINIPHGRNERTRTERRQTGTCPGPHTGGDPPGTLPVVNKSQEGRSQLTSATNRKHNKEVQTSDSVIISSW